jgi:thymidylate synthase ThyX
MTDLGKKARKYNPPLTQKYSKDGKASEEKAARKALEHFVTNPDASIYAMTPLVPELFSALLKARYSRTELSAKELLWREFVSKKTHIPWKTIEKGMEAVDEVFNFKKALGVAERILLQYGDDSVFELGGAHLFLDRISMIATKIVEDARIGLSPLEKSTRYVVFDQKDENGDYSFFKDPKIMESDQKDLYLQTCRDLFETYAKAVSVFLDYYRKQVPIDKQEFTDLSKEDKPMVLFSTLTDEKSIKAARNAYNASIRAKACDVARVLLPAATLTNVGEFGNARAYGYLFTKMLTHPIAEMQMIAQEGVDELKKVLPKFFDIVDNAHGLAYQEYLRKTEESLEKRAHMIVKGIKPEDAERVTLVQLDKDPEVNIAAALLYPYVTLPLQQLVKLLKKLGPEVVADVLRDSLKFRTNRRHKPPRGFEIAGYELVFDIVGNFGIFRDMHRQRILTQQRQLYTTELGFDMPVEFTEVGLNADCLKVIAEAEKAYKNIKRQFPQESQYLTTLGHKMRWYMGMNLREAFWVTELRSVPQGHFSYRTVAQDMYLKAQLKYPFLKDLKFNKEEYVDMSDRSKNLERMEAMQRIEKKLAEIEEKYS